MKNVKDGIGQQEVWVEFGRVTFSPGDYVCCVVGGILVEAEK
jgi:regulator of RNase E activity RraA